jgi:hypothetical protein
MKNNIRKLTAVFTLLIVVLLAAGCGGGGGSAPRITGLSADGVVKTFFDEAKSGRLNDAAQYVSPSTTNDPRVVIKYLTGKSGLDELKNANLLSLRKAAEQGDYAVVVATLQPEQNSLNVIVRPVGLEKLNGEWYIVDFDKIYQDAKYKLLQQLLSKI